jgi:hypothetical protein
MRKIIGGENFAGFLSNWKTCATLIVKLAEEKKKKLKKGSAVSKVLSDFDPNTEYCGNINYFHLWSSITNIHLTTDDVTVKALQLLPLLAPGSKRGVAACRYLLDIRSVISIT